ncbi:hypothetical protein V2J09_018886 [Rumex salicifolius]
MNCLMWNCHGARSDGFHRIIRYLVNQYMVNVLVLMETRIFRETTHKVYAPPMPTRRRPVWIELFEAIRSLNDPILIGGDFNENEWGVWVFFRQIRMPSETGWIALVSLTWASPDHRLLGLENIYDLDAHDYHLAKVGSDHAPLLLDLDPLQSNNRQQRPFRFEAWNRSVFGNIHQRKKKTLARLEGIQRAFMIKRKRNMIKGLRNAENEIITDNSRMEDMALEFFRSLYTLPEAKNVPFTTTRGGFPIIDE